ncbi:hypothetical protein AB1Y20_013210 [Prymnesium parvum]|uniref:Uncharacterized protein n=2 Tax=Prymnesium parvum TaxID=97485 RepID=A0AB34IMS2_PRYPA
MWMVAGGLPMRLNRRPVFRDYARSLEPRIVLPHNETVHRLASLTDELQLQYLRRARANHIAMFKGLPCIGLQLDLWTDRNSGIAYAAVHASMVMVASDESVYSKESPPLCLMDELLHFRAFPYTKHTAKNISEWLVGLLTAEQILAEAISGVTPDGASDGQAGCKLVEGLKSKVDVCQLHELQRCILYSIGLAGSKQNCRNRDFRDLIRVNKRLVQLTHQSREVSDALRKFQMDNNIPDHKIISTVCTNQTRWSNQKAQISRNNLMRPIFDPVMSVYRRENVNETAILEVGSESDDSEGETPRGPYSGPARELKRKDIGFKDDLWNANLEAEAFLTRPADMKQIMENNRYVTGAQGVHLMINLKKLNSPFKPLKVFMFPTSMAVKDRERAHQMVEAENLADFIPKARAELVRQIDMRFVDKEFSDARLVHLYMSKGIPAEKVLSADNLQRAKALYLKWLRSLVTAGVVGIRSSPRKKKKKEKVNLLDAMHDSDDDDSATMADDCRGQDRVREEMLQWQELPAASIKKHIGDQGLLNEFTLIHEFRDELPLHYKLFMQVASHRGNEANAEDTFSLSGSLSNRNTHTQPGFLATLVRINKNRRVSEPTWKAILSAYKHKHRKLPTLGDDVTDDEDEDADADPVEDHDINECD